MIRQRLVTFAAQPLGQRLDLAPRPAVDDARLAVVPRENRLELLVQVAAAQHAIGEVRPIERADEHERVVQSQFVTMSCRTRSVAVAVNA